MSNLQKWENIIREKRKKTSFSQFIEELGSWYPMMFYRNNGLISKFPESDRVNVISLKQYNEERDILCSYGLKYNPLKSFLDQITELYRKIPNSNICHVGNNENCNFCETAVNVKDAYLSSIVTHSSEKVCYSDIVREHCTNVFNSCYIQYNSDNVYTSFGVDNSFNVFYSRFIRSSNNIWFSTNLIGCSECIFCNSLENQKYCINDKKLDKEEYFKQKKIILSKKEQFLSWYKKLINIKGINYNSKNVSGSYIIESENVENGFVVTSLKNARNVFLCGSAEMVNGIYDQFTGGVTKDSFVGVVNSGGWSENIYMSVSIGFSSNIYYSMNLDSCSFCLGCIGLKNKSFCILNKQYSKEEWYEMADKIFEKMNTYIPSHSPSEEKGDKIKTELGEFFPPQMNPFYFNDTLGILLSKNVNKDKILKKGYLRRDEEIKTDIPENMEVVYINPPKSPFSKGGNEERVEMFCQNISTIDDFQGFDENGNWQINKDILNKTIIDENNNSYKIIPLELDFLQKYSMPIPEIHWINRRKLHFNF